MSSVDVEAVTADQSRWPAPSLLDTKRGAESVGTIRVHEFMTLDGVIDAPTWTVEYGFDPKMGDAIGGLMVCRS